MSSLVHSFLGSLHENAADFHLVFVVLTNRTGRASLVEQWLGVCLPMQRSRVRALVWEDPTCRGATRPVSHNY